MDNYKIVLRHIPDSQQLTSKTTQLTNLHPVLRKVYLSRGVITDEQLNKHLITLLPYHNLLNIGLATKYLAEALVQQKSIVIVGDYDVDGATSVTLVMLALRAMGAKVNYIVPNRFEDGYGLTEKIAELAHQKYAAELLITVDNGITSISGVERAKHLAMQVIITDHHLPGPELPKAAAIVNPNQGGDSFASKNLAGVGVAFYLMVSLRAYLRETDWFNQTGLVEPNLAQWLDLVAVGTVADVVTLDQNNRLLVHHGLTRIQNEMARPGILALLKIARRDYLTVNTQDLGFAVGPRLNAAGRLQDMSLGVECLLADDWSVAMQLASKLDNLNQQRKTLEHAIFDQALTMVDKVIISKDTSQQINSFCLFAESWHQGVIGIIAGRIKQQFYRPTIIFAPDNQGSNNLLKGSGRSIEGVHLREVLQAVNDQTPGLIQKFGGHAMAAGLVIARDRLSEFSQQFEQQVSLVVNQQILERKIITDGELHPEDFSIGLAKLLRDSEPWGQNFPVPTFVGDFRVTSLTWLKQKHIKLTLEICGAEPAEILTGIIFNIIDKQLAEQMLNSTVTLVYQLAVNQFRSRQSLQLLIEHWEIKSLPNTLNYSPLKSPIVY